MKILIVDNAHLASIRNEHYYTNQYNGDFVKDLIKKGNTPTYFQFAIEGNNNTKTFDLKKNGIKCVTARVIKNKCFRYLIAYWKLFIEIRKVDFVYFYFPGSFKYGTFICRLLKIKYGLYIRGMQGINNKIAHSIYKGAHTIFTVSESFTEMVNIIAGKDVANTIRPMIPYTENDIVFGREYELKDKYHILYFSRVVEDKGIRELLEAVKFLKENSEHNFSLEIVGDGEFYEQSKQITKELGIEDIVEFSGAIFDKNIKKEIFTKSDIYILPTYHEGFPRTHYEAMLFGTPIITTFVGGIPSLMKENDNCIKIEPKSTKSIIEKLEWAMNNYNLMGKYANKAIETVCKIVDSKRLTHGCHLSSIINKIDNI